MNKKILYSVLLILTVLASSCESWLDVQPRTKVKADDLFETEAGFKDALIGAYTLMKVEELYGRELTYGFLDVMPGYYATFSNEVYANVAEWKFLTDSKVRTQIDKMWSKMYNMLANVNNLLDYIDNRKSVFSGDNYNIIKGEALGLRAYIHFDLLRLFASAADLDKEAIPYVKTLQIEVPQVYTGKEVLALLNQDITEALVCLEKDPIREGKLKDLTGDGFMNNRQMRMNYFAVRGLQARVALWGRDLKTAKDAAGEILEIADDIFPWVTTDAVSATADKDRDFTFSTEHLFALNVKDLRDLANTWFLANAGKKYLYCQEYSIKQYYEIGMGNNVGGSDYRVNYVMQYDNNIYGYRSRKYYQPDNYNTGYAKRIPLIRRSEMSYIMAECLMEENPGTALEFLNEVRKHRGIISDLTDATKIREELTKEYTKEFLGEGQLFYYCKRNELSNFPYMTWKPASEENVYILPKPDLEIEFGDYYTTDNVK